MPPLKHRPWPGWLVRTACAGRAVGAHAHATGFCENIPGVEIEIESITATADAAFGIWKWTGQPNQPMGTSSNGNPVFPQRVLSVFRLRDGMLIDYEAFVDAGQVRAQISAL